MRTLTKILAASALAAGLAVSASANATVMTIRLVIDGVDQSLGAYSETNTHTFFDGAFGDVGVTITGNKGNNPLLSTQSLDAIDVIAGGVHDIDIYVSAFDYLTPNGPSTSYKSLFNTNNLTGLGWTLNEATWINSSNLDPAFGPAGTTQLAHAFMTSGGPELPVQYSITPFNPGGGSYALATEYHLHTGGSGQANSTITIENGGGIPEPATWGLMLVGFGGAGAMLRRRRAVAAAA